MMSSMLLVLLVVAAALVIALVVWELFISEGAHLGRRFVVGMYDLAAARYEGIKKYDRDWERQFLGEPLAAVLSGFGTARLLDVGAGTGRLERALGEAGRQGDFIVAIEPSKLMIEQALAHAENKGAQWVRAWATPLPFPQGAFDVVASLEVLEFTPSPRRTLEELIRVLRPGGWLLITNRVGWQAPLILGRTYSRDAFPELLASAGMVDVEVFAWQMDYDLAWARKPGRPETPPRA